MRTSTHALAPESTQAIDLAPMLDFVVNLLVFFIVTAVFVKQAGISVQRPSTAAGDAEKPSRSIVIDARGEVSIDGRGIDRRAVRAHVERFRSADSEAGIVIVADRHAPTGAVVEVVDQAHLGGIWDIVFTTGRADPEGAP